MGGRWRVIGAMIRTYCMSTWTARAFHIHGNHGRQDRQDRQDAPRWDIVYMIVKCLFFLFSLSLSLYLSFSLSLSHVPSTVAPPPAAAAAATAAFPRRRRRFLAARALSTAFLENEGEGMKEEYRKEDWGLMKEDWGVEEGEEGRGKRKEGGEKASIKILVSEERYTEHKDWIITHLTSLSLLSFSYLR